MRARLIESGYGNVDISPNPSIPSLLGGLVLRIGARLFDSSLKSRLTAPAIRHEGSRLMEIRPAEISEILKQQIASFDTESERRRDWAGAVRRRRHRPHLRLAKHHGRRDGLLPRRGAAAAWR